MSAARALSLLVGRELRLSFRRPDQLLQPLVFFLIVTTMFPLGLNPEASLLKDMAPGVLWTAALLSSLLSLESMFKGDADDGTLEQLALSGHGLTVIVIGKTAAHWLLSGAALVLASPLVAIALGIPGAAFGTMFASLTLGTLTLSWLGAIGAALTVGLKRGNVLLSLIVLPLAMPLLSLAGLFFVPGKRRRRWLTLGVLLCASLGALTALSGCGGGFQLPGATSTPCNITVNGANSSGAIVSTTTVQLTVQ